MAGRHLGPVRQRQRRNAAAPARAGGRASSSDAWREGVDHVRSDVVREVGRQARPAADGLRSGRSIDELYQQLGVDRFAAIVAKVIGRRPSPSTIYRWRKADRIPDRAVAQRIQREALIERLGGTRQVAGRIGVSPSTVRRFVTGKTKKLRSPRARGELVTAQNDDAAQNARLDNHQQPNIQLRGDFSIVSSLTDYPIGYRNIMMGPHNTSMADQTIEDLFDAYLNVDEYRLTAIIESALTIDYFGENYDGFSTYSASNRVRIDRIEYLDIEWPHT